jgi:DNA-binding FrmR family transcriptional regulator
METERKAAAINRVRSAIGHLQAIERMLAEDAYCIDVMAQVQAVQAALGKINEVLLQNHLEHCVTDALRSDDAARRERVIDELRQVYTMSRKVRLKPERAGK